jgi:hypothetical protein
MIIGGQAVLLHGEARLTEDIDVTLGVGPAGLDLILAACKDLSLDALPDRVESFVRETFVLPAADPRTGIRVDFIFSTTGYEAEAIRRAQRVDVGRGTVAFATAEDLIIHKLFAGRPRDLEDARGVVRRKGPSLDWPYLQRWAVEFGRLSGREGMPRDMAELEAESDPN